MNNPIREFVLRQTTSRSQAKASMSERKIKLINGGKEIELPIAESTEGPAAVSISNLYKKRGYFSLDPGFVSTASCQSQITYIDGDLGLLRYRGYPIEQLAESGNHIETSYLLLNGELPTREQLDVFSKEITEHTEIHDKTWDLFQAFSKDAHPMAMLMAGLSHLASVYHSELDVFDEAYRQRMARKLIAQIPVLAALGYRYRTGQSPIGPDVELDFTANFLYMMYGTKPNALFSHALDTLFLLHADHEQNASTSTVRLSGSSETSPVAAIAAGVATLWGPSHGGANEAVIKMLEEIHASGISIEEYVEQTKDKGSHSRLMGFGHRVYKNYDPRAKLIQKICYDLLEKHGEDNPSCPLLKTAMALEKTALNDEYFVDRKLYPNVDFYSGIILKTMGIPLDMFTVIFAIARTSGWVSHWLEMMADKQFRIGRPRQLYTGHTKRDYMALDQRS